MKLRNCVAYLSDGLAVNRTATAKMCKETQRKCFAVNSKGREKSATIRNGMAANN